MLSPARSPIFTGLWQLVISFAVLGTRSGVAWPRQHVRPGDRTEGQSPVHRDRRHGDRAVRGGLTTGDIAKWLLRGLLGEARPRTVANITDSVTQLVKAWRPAPWTMHRPLVDVGMMCRLVLGAAPGVPDPLHRRDTSTTAGQRRPLCAVPVSGYSGTW
jgi:hypothetical protein